MEFITDKEKVRSLLDQGEPEVHISDREYITKENGKYRLHSGGFVMQKEWDFNELWSRTSLGESNIKESIESGESTEDIVNSLVERKELIKLSDMESEGFNLEKEEEKNGVKLYWFTHPKIKDHHFLIRADQRGVLVGQGKIGSGISTTLDNIQQVFNHLEQYIK